MKTNYRPRNSAIGHNRKRLGITLGILIVGILIFSFLRNPLINITAPFWKSNFFSRTFLGTVALVRSKESLENENQSLKAQLDSYNSLVVSSRVLEDSRDQLLTYFNRASTTPGIAAAVLVHPPETPYDMLVIDAGTSEGVALGNRVSLPEGVVIGNVSQVSTYSARVDLYSGSGNTTDAVLERNSLPVTLIGQGGSNFEFDLPKGVAVEDGDKILSPNIRSEMIAVVGDVESDPTDSLEHVYARSVVDVFTLRFVLVKP
jgi:cell shape-determining protein MreC